MSEKYGHIYPAWAGALLVSPIRRRMLDPETFLNPYIRPGMAIADIGCGFGFFSLPLAKAAGPKGKVFCIDSQEGMLEGLRKRAVKARLADRVVPRHCLAASLDAAELNGSIDFALAFNTRRAMRPPPKSLTNRRKRRAANTTGS